MSDEGTGQRHNWREIAQAYEQVVIRSSAYQGMMADMLAQLGDAQRVIDLGCGPGYLLSRLLEQADREVVGVELMAEMLELARESVIPAAHLGRAALICSPVETYRHDGELFDAVASSNLLFNLREPDALLGGALRLLRPGGRLVLTSASDESDFARLSREVREDFARRGVLDEKLPYIETVERVNRRFQGEEDRFLRFSRDEIAQLLLDTGFREIVHSATTYGGQNFLVVAVR